VSRVARLLRVRPGEGRVASRLLAMMFVVWFGFALGGNAVEGLLFARVGPNVLPYLFVALGVTTSAVMLGMNALLSRPRPQRLLLSTLPAMAGAVLVMRGLLALDQKWLYEALWLAMMVLWVGVGVVTWGIAGAVHDTRQAKRLFPLYGSGLILGVALGGLATAPLARGLGAENLLFLWAVTSGLTFVLARSALRVGGAMVGPSRSRGARSSQPLGERLALGLRTVRGTPLLSWMALSLALFAVLYFSLALLFARAATARFPDADRLAGFLGVFMGATYATALLVSLFASNRLSAWLGVATTVLILPLVYLAGFPVLSVSLAFAPLVIFRFFQMVAMNGVWAGSWQALYNVVPPERRDGTRAFVDGVALQAGVVSAGIILILADRVLRPRAVALIALGVAGLATVAAFRLRGAYAGAVVEALRAGNPDVFPAEEEPFGGVRRDAAAMSVAAQAASDPDPAVRRVSVEVLAEIGGRGAAPVFFRALNDDDPVVRAAALRGIARLGPEADTDGERDSGVTAMLGDAEASVRLAAVEAASVRDGRGTSEGLRPLLADPDPWVRARTAAVLLGSDAGEEARRTLAVMASSREAEWRTSAVAVLAEADPGSPAVASALADSDPQVRRAGVTALAGRDSVEAAKGLVDVLADADPGVRAEAVEALTRMGDHAVGPLMEATSRPGVEHEAMRALARLGGTDRSVLRGYVRQELAEALRYQRLLGALGASSEPRHELLAHSLRHRSLHHTLNALRVASGLWDPVGVGLAIENLESRDPAQRANALETMEAVGESDMVRPLLAAWEDPAHRSDSSAGVLAELMGDADPWLRACAAFASAATPELRPEVERLAASDTDSLVRDAAAASLGGERNVETLPSLSLMERIVFLRRVPLFVEMAPADLKHVAEIASEHLYPDGEVIAAQGEAGEEMYVVVSGEIGVLVGREGASPIEVARRVAGDCIGEMAVISRAPRMASLVTHGPVRTLAIDRRRFERILRERPEASLAVMGVLCERLRESHRGEPLEARA
jgi:HEAT repeat protein/ATP/ADP translocase